MKIVTGLLLALMLLFMAVQVNDPDGLLWVCIYAVPAVWCAMATFWRQVLAARQVMVALWASIAMALAGVIYFWPLTPRFWAKEVWYEVESAREGMGLMIVMGVLLVVLYLAKSQVASEVVGATTSER